MAATDSHLRFALALHQGVGAGGGDSCFSPYSVASALTLGLRAARGETADQLGELLGEDQADLLKAATELPAATGAELPEIGVSNTLWAWDELPLEDSFKTELAGWPGASIESAPFQSDPEAARSLINADVREATHGLIPELLPAGSVDEDTVAALVNALYLKASWNHPFPEQNTGDLWFKAPSGKRKVPAMSQQERMGYARRDGWQIVQLGAAGGVCATILLPDATRDLGQAEALLDAPALAELLDEVHFAQVRLTLPKVSLDVQSPLKALLQNLGVRRLFTSDAELGGISSDPRLYVQDVLHQAVLKLDEKGLEGAAATAMTFALMSASISEPVVVEVDRPFLLLVRHPGTGAVYFFARVVEP